MNPSRRPDPIRLITEGGTPFTRIVVACYVATFLADWVLAATPARYSLLLDWIAYIAPVSLHHPWTLLTYAVASSSLTSPALTSSDIIWLFFDALFMLFVGASLERSWGTRTFAIFFFAMALATSLGLTLGALLAHTFIAVPAGLVLGAAFVAFALLNPDLTINLYGCIPLKTRWLMWADIAIIFFTYGRGNPLIGVFALSGCAAAWLWIRNLRWTDAFIERSTPSRFSVPRTPFKPPKVGGNNRRRDDDFSWRDLNPFERIARARRKKKFARLFEDDDKDYKS